MERIRSIRIPRVDKTRLRRGAIVAALGLLVAAALYVVGLLQGRGQMGEVQAAYERRLTEQEAELQALTRDLQTAQAIQQLLTAQGSLYRAALELDQRNFGSANHHVVQARNALQAVEPTAAGVEPARLEPVRTAVANVNILVVEDIGAQRRQVLEAASLLDGLVETAARAQQPR